MIKIIPLGEQYYQQAIALANLVHGDNYLDLANLIEMQSKATKNGINANFIALEDELNALHSAIETQDYPSIVRKAHIFTTALRYIGAFTLAELASSIELTITRNEHTDTENFKAKLELFYTSLTKMREQLNATP